MVLTAAISTAKITKPIIFPCSTVANNKKYFAKKPPVNGMPESDNKHIAVVAAKMGLRFAKPLKPSKDWSFILIIAANTPKEANV